MAISDAETLGQTLIVCCVEGIATANADEARQSTGSRTLNPASEGVT